MDISIHAPREGGRRLDKLISMYSKVFQSTPPARGATTYNRTADFTVTFQSTPPARGATQKWREIGCNAFISIHAPREGGDP